MPFRLLHLADLHLDRSFAGLGCQGDLARRRRQGLRSALEVAGQAAQRHGCAAVTIGGDLYEHERCGHDTERFLVETFRSWQPLKVLIAPGNHDALMPGSVYSRAEWPSNVFVFQRSELQPVELTGGLTLWGAAHREPAWRGNPLDGFAAPAEGVHLGLFHGSELGLRPEGKPAHGPFRLAEIAACGLASLLCGHYHRRRIDLPGRLLYPGSPEPLSFDEEGGRGPLIVDVRDDGTIACAGLSLNRWWMVCVECPLDGCRSTSQALDAAETALDQALRPLDPDFTMVRLELVGQVDPAMPLDIATLEALLRERCRAADVSVRDATRPALTLEVDPAERSTRAAFRRTVEEAMATADEEEAAVLEDALRYGLMALAGAEVGLR